jgi:protein O-GlcNAc transferase
MYILLHLALLTLLLQCECSDPNHNLTWIDEEYHYLHSLTHNPSDTEANTHLGLLYAQHREHTLAKKYLKQAVIHGNWSNVTVLTNYALQLSHISHEEAEAAVTLLELALNIFHPQNPNILYMIGLISLKEGNMLRCHKYYSEVVASVPPPPPEMFIMIISSFNDMELNVEGTFYITEAVKQYPEHARLLFVCGVSFHLQSRYDLALEFYQMSGKYDPSYDVLYVNIASVYQMLGRLKEAKSFYEHVYMRLQDDSGFLNNYGSLLLAMNEYEMGEKLLLQSIEADPEQEFAFVNLAGYYQDEGLIKESKELLIRGMKWSPKHLQLELRVATMLSPVASSWSQMLDERRSVVQLVAQLNNKPAPAEENILPLMSGLDRVHFYIQYHGLNDRSIQESIAQYYRKVIRNLGFIAPHNLEQHAVSSSSSSSSSSVSSRTSHTTGNAYPRQKIRIGFMSKLFGVFEPHGLLLDGIIKFLPRDRFRVIALEVAAGGAQKIVSPLIATSADELIEISLDHVHAMKTLSDLRLDILVFADVLSEPMNHFLLHSRFAPVQIAFWGNPITSASHHVDYFMSSDFMEHPFRTRIPYRNEPYSEQVVLSPGQGIWYYGPHSAEMKLCEDSVASIVNSDVSLSRNDFELDPEWFVFLCPQSVFKLHPLFDQVIAALLRQSPSHVHVVFTAGRRPRWTQTFVQRLEQAIHPDDTHRCHLVERVSSEMFIEFIKVADAILHPFPFDGSRTSADSIAAHIPYVTLPTEYLRGRMGASFLRTMNIPELVAKNVTDFVHIAVKLSTDISFFRTMKDLLQKRSWLIWEDMEVPFAWTKFLSLSIGAQYSHTFEEFIASCAGRNVTREVLATSERNANQQMFDQRWGQSHWLLNAEGVAVLEEDVGSNESDSILAPRLFREVI